MNEIVAQFIEKKRLEQKKEHLLNLGLVEDDNELKKIYCSNNFTEYDRCLRGFRFKDEKGYYKFVGDPKVIEVSDEEYEEICKICPPHIFDAENNPDKFQYNLLKKVDSIRKMVLFFMIITVVGLVLSLLIHF